MISDISIIDILNIKDISVFAVLIGFIFYLIYVNNKSLSKIEESVVELKKTYEAILNVQRESQKHILERLDKREDLIIDLIRRNDRH